MTPSLFKFKILALRRTYMIQKAFKGYPLSIIRSEIKLIDLFRTQLMPDQEIEGFNDITKSASSK